MLCTHNHTGILSQFTTHVSYPKALSGTNDFEVKVKLSPAVGLASRLVREQAS